MLNVCPICDANVLVTLASYDRCVTSDSEPVDARVDNVFCKGCGTVVNATGVRGREAEFYREMYTLLDETADAEFMYDTSRGRRGINDEMVDFLRNSGALARDGRLLEIGAGKGVFLDRFGSAFPGWTIAAVEPSRAAFRVLQRRTPQARLHAGDFHTSPFRDERFDLIVLIGVLEHVPDPFDFLRDVQHCLADSGIAMIGVPNFDNNPTDLLTYDHLTRFTPDSLRYVTERAGLMPFLWNVDNRVPMWTLARAGPINTPDASPAFASNAFDQAHIAANWIIGSLGVFDQLGYEIDPTRRLAIYGTGTIAIAAVQLSNLSRNQIMFFIDDNVSLHGGTRLELPVIAFDAAIERGITDVGFSANPCYLKSMEEKARNIIGNSARIWPLPSMEFEQE